MPVYFVQAGDDGAIKIGYAADPSRRIEALKTACPAELRPLGYIDGDRDKERELHQRFAADRVTGEWFRPTPQLLALVANARPIRDRRRSSPTIALAKLFGGNRELAKIAGVGPTAVSNWHKRGLIPPRLYLQIRKAAIERGLPAPEALFFRETSAAA